MASHLLHLVDHVTVTSGPARLKQPATGLAEAKKPEHHQYHDDQTNNVNESIHDVPCM
jgi:hypothetical protein